MPCLQTMPLWRARTDPLSGPVCFEDMAGPLSPELNPEKKGPAVQAGPSTQGIGAQMSYGNVSAAVSDTPLFDSMAAAWSMPSIGSVTLDDEPRARAADPVTSHEAADSISGEAREASELFVLDAVKAYGPITDAGVFDLAQISGHKWSPSRLRTARAQLVSKGLVTELDHEGRSASGRRMTRWAVA